MESVIACFLTTDEAIDLIGIAIPELIFQSRDSGLAKSQSRDPVGIGTIQIGHIGLLPLAMGNDF